MTLAINIGNTNLWMGLQVNAQIVSCRRLTINCNSSQDIEECIRIFIKEHGIPLQKISGCIISSTVPEKSFLVTEAVCNCIAINPILVTSGMDFGIDTSFYDNSLIGIDRLLCCMAASFRSNLPVIVYDLGTATTANIVNNEGVFLGGAILPGIDIGLSALVKSTALLPKVKPVSTAPLIGRNTNECLLSGAIYGTTGFIDDYTDRINTALGTRATVIITGGNAPRIIPYLKTDFIYYPNLLLEGLFSLFARLHVE